MNSQHKEKCKCGSAKTTLQFVPLRYTHNTHKSRNNKQTINMIANCNCFFLAALFVLTVTVTSSVCEIGNSIESEETPTAKSNLIEKLRTQIKIKQRELENAEKINKNFERMIQLVNIMGQVDTFLTDRTRLVLRKLALLADDMETPTKKGGSQHRIKF